MLMATKEKDYAAIAKARMYRPADEKRPPRYLIYSRNKKGKTTFTNSAGTDVTLIADPEYGTKEMKVSNPHVWPITSWADLDDFYEFCRHVNMCQICPQPHPFKWLGIDGLTRMSNLGLRHVMKLAEERSLDRIPGLVQKQDYGKAGELMKELLIKFHNLPQGIIFTAQERMEEGSDSEEDSDYEGSAVRFVPDLPKGARGAANSIVDVIGRLYVVQIEKEDGEKRPERRLWIADSVKYDTGYRSDHELPPYIRRPTVPRVTYMLRHGSLPTRKKTAKAA